MLRGWTGPILFKDIFSRHSDSMRIVRFTRRQDLLNAVAGRGLSGSHGLLLALDQLETIRVFAEGRDVRLVGAGVFGPEGRICPGRLAGRLATVRRAEPAGVSEERFDAWQRCDHGGDETFAIGPAESDRERRDTLQRVVGPQDGTDHNE